jgi:hypothetical protein
MDIVSAIADVLSILGFLLTVVVTFWVRDLQQTTAQAGTNNSNVGHQHVSGSGNQVAGRNLSSGEAGKND